MVERVQELSQRRGGIHPAEQRAHAAVTQHVKIVDTVCSGEHARHHGGHLAAGVGTLVTVDADPLGHDAV